MLQYRMDSEGRAACIQYTHHQRRSNPNEYGVNVGCFDDADLAVMGEMTTNPSCRTKFPGRQP